MNSITCLSNHYYHLSQFSPSSLISFYLLTLMEILCLFLLVLSAERCLFLWHWHWFHASSAQINIKSSWKNIKSAQTIQCALTCLMFWLIAQQD
jgi:hypothetical protein